MSKRGENIYRRKDGRWEARYVKGRNGNRAVYGYLYAKTYAEAKIKQTEALKTHSDIRSIRSGGTFPSLAEAFILWKKHHVKESTLSNYRYKIRKYITPYFESIEIRQIDGLCVDRFIDYLFTAENLAPKTVKDIATLLDSLFTFAKENNFITAEIKVPVPKAPKKEVKVMTANDLDRLVRYLLSDMSFEKLGVLVSLITGMRIGEICALKKRAFDFDGRTVSVSGTLQRIADIRNGKNATKVVLTTPKSEKSIRVIPIAEASAIWLFERLKQIDSECYVVTGTGRYCEPRNYYKKFKKILRDCCLDGKGYTFHTLRHTFATEAILYGMNAKSLSEILGHSNVKITLERYVHPSFEQKRIEVEKVMSCHPLQSYLQSHGKKRSNIYEE